MTAPRSLAAVASVVAALLMATGCDAPLAPDRESTTAAEASPEPTSAPTSAAPASPDPGLAAAKARASARAKARAKADAKAKAEATAAEARRRAAAEAGPVLAISVDGLNPTALGQLGAGRLPNLFALIRGGASTLNARTALERTETLPNHTGMLTGRPVTGPAGHEVDFNTDPGRATVSSHAGRPIASVFDVVHAAGRPTAMYASKSKFALYQRSWAASIDRAVIVEDNDQLVTRLVAELGRDPAAFTFVHLSAPDGAGHDSGFMGTAYLRAVERVDVLLGRIRQALATSPSVQGRATLVVTADHGGRGANGHADAGKLDDFRIPFIVYGPTARPGSDLYDLNPDYRDPGTSRPSYAGAQPVRNADVASLVTRLLGLAPVPGSVFGVTDPLDVH